jgi:CIC family chloride channel protein
MSPVKSGPRKPYGPVSFLLLSILVGVVAGLGAVLFRGLIAFFHNFLFLGKLSIFYDANIHTPSSPWGPLIVLAPVVGAVGVVFLVKNFAPEAKGHGVPEVIDAIHYHKGGIRPIVALIKSLASALTIGSGGSVGREGPIIQIGSAFGSTIGLLLRMSPYERTILIAAGAGGGIAATFNTPVGGVLFAVELLLQEVSVKTLVPVAVATVTATYIGQVFFGAHPSFVIPAFETPFFHVADPVVLFSYAGLGGIMGLASTLLIKWIYSFEDYFETRIRGGYYTRHMFGMFLVGAIFWVCMPLFGHYYVEGVGYSTIQEILSGMRLPFFLLLLLFFLKLVATSLTLGSGGSGGIFSPSLYIGATLGGAYGLLLNLLFPKLAISPPAFAVAGMAGMVGGVTGAAMTAIVMTFEMTLDYSVILPMTITVAISYGVRKMLCRESIYTQKLARRGHLVPDALRATLIQVKSARDVMDNHFTIVPGSLVIEEFVRYTLPENPVIHNFLVIDDRRIIGMVTAGIARISLEQGKGLHPLGSIAAVNYLTIPEQTSIFSLFSKVFALEIDFVLVSPNGSPPSPEAVRGLITKERLAEFVAEAAEQF